MSEVEARGGHKPRKSVSFSGGATVVDSNGEVTQQSEANANHDKMTAESHSLPQTEVSDAAPAEDKAVDEVTDLFKGLSKKKKKKVPKEGDAEDTPVEGDFEGMVKKKKKKKKPADTDDFEAKLAEAGVTEGQEGEETATGGQEGDLDAGTGIWEHNNKTPIGYQLLLQRFFYIVQNQNPDILTTGSKSYKIPPPQCLREGNKKTIFANISDICKRMKRSDEHVTQFLFAELGTTGSVDGSRRLVIKGRFQQKQIENVLRRYILEYVTCKTCRSANTELSKGENRLFFLTCNSCGSRRSVTAIKTGFTAQIGKRRRPQG